MTYETTIIKTPFNGWTAETVIPLETLTGGLRILEVSTLKRHSGKIITIATVFVQTVSSKETIIFEDYSKGVAIASESRATEKTVLKAHKKALLQIQTHIDAAKAQYNIA